MQAQAGQAVYWRKARQVDILWDVYHRYTFVRQEGADEDRGDADGRQLDGPRDAQRPEL